MLFGKHDVRCRVGVSGVSGGAPPGSAALPSGLNKLFSSSDFLFSPERSPDRPLGSSAFLFLLVG